LFLKKKGDASQDNYSYGMLLIEILTRDIPFGKNVDSMEVKKNILKGFRPTLPQDCKKPYAELIKKVSKKFIFFKNLIIFSVWMEFQKIGLFYYFPLSLFCFY
jgi:hypothetical protein